MAFRLRLTEVGEDSQISAAITSASSSALPGAVTALTTPRSFARSGSSVRPVIKSSRATLIGSARGARKSAPDVATRPRLVSGRPNCAVAEATIRSQASAISKPPPSA